LGGSGLKAEDINVNLFLSLYLPTIRQRWG
jgi:hypothetical protein